MALGALKPAPFKPQKESITTWNTWKKGLNLLLRETEVGGDECVQATNLLLTGSGVPTKRWGSQNYFQAGDSGNGRGLLSIKDAQDNIQVLAITDSGVMVKKSNASYITLNGASWASGYNVEMTQLGGKVYIVNGNREMVRYDFTSLTGFPTISRPTNLAATNYSGATGGTTWSWRVTSLSRVGETLGSDAVVLPGLPQDLTNTLVKVNWTPVSTASGDLTGYAVYRGNPGDEVFVGGTDNLTTTFDDRGDFSPDPTRTTPIADTTGGPIADLIMRYQDRLIMAKIPGAPTKVIISGRYPQHERFDIYAGGGSVLVEPDSGESITGLSTYYFQNTQTIIAFKEKSVWEIALANITFGNTILLNPSYRLLTASQGCSSQRSIVPVENDIMFANRKGIYILRYEPQLISVINANEISAKIRPFFEGLTDADHTSATAAYADKKYVLSYPNARKTIIFDRERLSFMGPWDTTFGINKWATYIDELGIERWIAIDSSDSFVTEFRKSLVDDKGTPFRTIFKTKKEDFGDWTLFKTLNEIYMLFRNVSGSVSVNIFLEERSGQTVTAKSFTVTSATGTTGFGAELFGNTPFGISEGNATFTSNELPKKSFVYKTARTFQVELQTSGNSDNYELLGIKAIAIPQSRGNSPSAWTA